MHRTGGGCRIRRRHFQACFYASVFSQVGQLRHNRPQSTNPNRLVGCTIYNLFNKEKAKLCPGNVCSPTERVAIQKFSVEQFVILSLFIFFVFYISSSPLINSARATSTENTNASSEGCVVPQWAIEIGHEKQWKLHNNCP
jgi:hypothetical protein